MASDGARTFWCAEPKEEAKHIEVRDHSNGQKGVYATEDIPRFTVIGNFECLSMYYRLDEDEGAFEQKWGAELLARQEPLIGLDDLFPRGGAIHDKLRLNIFNTANADSFALYKTPSFINHSCNPNVTPHMGFGKTMHLFALRSISKGEEITVSYYSNIVKDQRALSDKYKFECNCGSCGKLDPVKYMESCISSACGNDTCKGRGLHRCTGCRWVRYCSRKCQRLDWGKRHKTACGQLTVQTISMGGKTLFL